MKKTFFLTILSFAIFSCSKNDDQIQTPVTVEPVVFFKGTMNGAAINYHMDNANSLSNTHELRLGEGYSGIGFDYYHYRTSGLEESPAQGDSKTMILGFDNIVHNNDSNGPTITEFDNAFLLSNLPTSFTTSSTQKYVSVNYWPVGIGNGDVYTTDGSQTGSSVTYSSSSVGTYNGAKSYTVIGKVTCKLYNSNNAADIITLTNCDFKLIYTYN